MVDEIMIRAVDSQARIEGFFTSLKLGIENAITTLIKGFSVR